MYTSILYTHYIQMYHITISLWMYVWMFFLQIMLKEIGIEMQFRASSFPNYKRTHNLYKYICSIDNVKDTYK